jgi:hypothetical protein
VGLLLLLLAASAPAARAELPAIVERSIAFHGGDEVRHAEIALTLTSLSGSSRIEARLDGGLFDYTVTTPAEAADGSSEAERRVRVTNAPDGDVAVYEERDGREVRLSGAAAERASRWLMAKVYFPFLPFRLADPGVRFEDQGLERWGERELRRVKVTFRAGSSPDADDEYVYWFDPDSGRMEQYAYSFHSGDGGLRLRLATGFHRAGGVLFSDQDNLGVNGPGLSVDQVTPGFAARRMEKVSEVRLSDVEVRPLAADAGVDR